LMLSTNAFDRKLQISGVILIVGLLVESLCLLSGSPIGFILFVGVGGLLIALGILYYLYSLASTASVK
ncbi:MAG TPA: hypothetical protein VNX66_00240, partial [Candidatus Sulfotelmatobacter sp.]|nr:hypothetical protein [Candidatus Sulfotelmatobacter sp.]